MQIVGLTRADQCKEEIHGGAHFEKKGAESKNHTAIKLKEPRGETSNNLLSKFEHLKPALQTDPHHLTVLF